MPLDSSIPLQTRGITMRPLGEAMQGAYQLQGMQQQTQQNALKLQQQQREMAAQEAFQKAVQETQGDYDAAIGILERQGFGDTALSVRKSLFEQRKQMADLLETQTKTTGEKLKQATQLMQGADSPDAYKRIVGRVRALVGPELAQQIPDVFDPAFVASAVQWGMSAAEKSSMRQAAATEARTGIDAAKDGRDAHGFYTSALAKWLSTVDTPDEWTQALAMGKQMGASAETLAQFSPTYSPEAVQQAVALSMTPEERAALALNDKQVGLQAASLGEQRRHNQVMEAKPVDDRLVQVMGPAGVPIWVKEADAAGQPAAQAPRAVTGAERQSLAYFNRAKQATEDITPLEGEIAKMGLGAQGRMQWAPNFLQSQTGQSYRQAQRAFTEARLRKESGAAIPPAEYENDAKTYFAQPGDKPETLEQKRQARQKVLDGMAYSAGKAYDEYYGEAAPRPGLAAPSNDPLTVTTPDGQTFSFPNKAQADAFRKRIGGR